MFDIPLPWNSMPSLGKIWLPKNARLLYNCQDSLPEKLPSLGPGYLEIWLHNIFESRYSKVELLQIFIGNPNGITYSEIAGPQQFCECAIFFWLDGNEEFDLVRKVSCPAIIVL